MWGLEDFAGERLRIARTFQGRTQAHLAAQLDVTQQFVAQLERGRKQPNAMLVGALGDVLGFEPEFFYGAPLTEFTDAECNFRRRRTTPISVRARALAFGTLFGQLLQYLRSQLQLPKQDVPHIRVSALEEIERAAEHCRMHWGLGLDLPIKNVVRVMERAGVPVTKCPGIGAKVDAFSRAGEPSVLVLTEKPASRCRYDVAHECGHLVLHHGEPTGTADVEAEANRFAAALLLPRAGFAREFPQARHRGWEGLFRVKQRWRVSLAAIIRRAAELSLIGGAEYLRLYKELSARGWLKHEPHEFEHELPEILPRALDLLRESFGLERKEVAHVLGWRSATFAAITGLEQSPMENSLGQGRLLPLPALHMPGRRNDA
jgi:Zn-dependent peptidase ImmA (M78 family)/transcriptional regulator with XRE-family HTH domain